MFPRGVPSSYSRQALGQPDASVQYLIKQRRVAPKPKSSTAVTLGGLGVGAVLLLYFKNKAKSKSAGPAYDEKRKRRVQVPSPVPKAAKQESLRQALKNFGYSKAEAEPVIASLDDTLPLETLIKLALGQLSATAVPRV